MIFDAAVIRTALKGHAVSSDLLIFVYYLYVSNKGCSAHTTENNAPKVLSGISCSAPTQPVK